MPDRLPSLILLAGFWIPPAAAGWAAARVVLRDVARGRAALVYAGLTTFVVAWSAAWFLVNRAAMPPYIPGSTHDPTFAPPEAVRALALVAALLVLPGSAVACVLAFRTRVRQ